MHTLVAFQCSSLRNPANLIEWIQVFQQALTVSNSLQENNLLRESMQASPTLARFLTTPENQSAITAIRGVLAAFQARNPHNLTTPLVLHGSSGTGKTHLATALIHELTRQNVRLNVRQLSANDWKLLLAPRQATPSNSAGRHDDTTRDMSDRPRWLVEAGMADFLVIED